MTPAELYEDAVSRLRPVVGNSIIDDTGKHHTIRMINLRGHLIELEDVDKKRTVVPGRAVQQWIYERGQRG